MKKIIFLLLLSCCIYSQDTVFIIMDEIPTPELPRNFRKTGDGFKRPFEKMPDTTGLNSLYISGSSEFSAMNFPALITAIGQKKVTVFDLRQETHFLVNGITISWYGKYDWADVGLSRDEILKLEAKRLDSVKSLAQLPIRRVIKKEKATDTFLEFKDTVLNVESVKSEETLVSESGSGYYRITATDHRQPVDSDVDLFISYVKVLSGSWLHFHCHAGDGRTTTFMVMYDMIKNAKRVGMDDIIERQYLIGGIDLTNTEDFPSWDKQYAVSRAAFLLSFYKYCKENEDGFKTQYSDWAKKQ